MTFFASWNLIRGFNPRTRESATYFFSIDPKMETVSIHALVRVRRVLAALFGEFNEFQSTHS